MGIKISQVVGPDLATRTGCDRLFEYLEQAPGKKITLDFSDVSSISRSFAHQYLMKKNSSTKNVSEIHVPVFVRDMFEFVKKGPQRKLIESNYVKSEIISKV